MLVQEYRYWLCKGLVVSCHSIGNGSQLTVLLAGLLCHIFQTLWDSSMISTSSFIMWQGSTDPAEQAGKGVALKSLTTFLTALGEADEDSSCEES